VIPYLFTCSLFNDAVSNQDYVAANDWVIMNWNETVVILFKTLTWRDWRNQKERQSD